MAFTPKSFAAIVADMAATVAANTPINDFTPGSNILTLLETAAQSDFQAFIQMIEVVQNYYLDTTDGEELDNRAFEFGLTRLTAKPHSGFVTVTDTRFDKIFTKLYAGLPGPIAGSTTIYVDNASDFPTSGAIYIGRGTENSEGPIAYSAAPVDNTSYWTISLDTALVNDHGTDETIILSQFGQRVIPAGTEVRIPENDFSEEVLFELNQAITLLDGENAIENVLVTALDPGGFSVPKNSIKQFVNAPFTGAVVSNPSPFVNGRDEETDAELRDRIRDTIQSLSRGTGLSIESGILGIIDTATNSSITSANVIPPVVLADGPTKVYIDNGRGLEPSVSTYGLETLISSATGGERFFQLSQFPLVKSNIISQLVEPFNLVGNETLIIKVGTNEETFTFEDTDFDTLGSVSATEVAEAINNRASIFEARTITDSTGSRVIITPIASANENLSLSASSTANAVFNFSTDEVFTLKLYKNDLLLNKDGLTATILSEAQPFDFSSSEIITTDDVTITSESKIVSKVGGSDDYRELINPGDYVRSSNDTDNFYTKVRTIVDANKLILEEPYPVGSDTGGTPKLSIWRSPQIEVAANGDLNETEIVSFSKNDFSSPSSVLASELLSRLQADVNLSNVELAINNTKLRFTSLLENSNKSKMRILGGHGALALGFSTSYGLTGTLEYNTASTVVNGTGTLFTQELVEGQWIKAVSDGNYAWTKIESIEDDTTLYLTNTYRGSSVVAPGAISVALTFGEESVGSNSDYILNRSNGQIELLEPLAVGDSLTAGSINTRAFVDSLPQLYNFDSLGATSNFIVRVNGGLQATVTVGDSVAPYDVFASNDLIDYPSGSFIGGHLECISGANAGETDVITGYNPVNGQITTASGFSFEISVSDKFIISQIIELNHASDFVDPENVTALEVVTIFNNRLKGITAQLKIDNSVRLRTNSFIDGSIEVLGGTANSILGFPTVESTNQESNIAFLISGNTDRAGIPDMKGFTLAPAQNLVTIFDADSANKTFATPMRIEGEITGGTANSLVVSSFISKYSTNDFFNDFWVYWKSGAANEGTVQVVTDYNALTGTITTSNFWPVGGTVIDPVAGDTVQLVPRTAENLVKLFSDLNTTTLTTAGKVEAIGATGDYVQIATKLPGTNGKVFVSGGTANSLGIAVLGPIVGEIDTPGIDEVQRLDFSSSPTTGGFQLEFDGQTTSSIDVIPAVNEVQNLNFSIVPDSGQFTLVYDSQQTAPLIVTPDANEVQQIDFSSVPDNGTFRLDFDGQVTAPISYVDDAAFVKARLESLSNIDLVNVTGNFTAGFTVEFQGVNALTDVPQLTVDFNSLTNLTNPVTIDINTITEGSVESYPSNTDIKNALEALSNIDLVNVTGDITTGNVQVEFQGSLAETDVNMLSVGLNTLTASAVPVTINITQTVAGAAAIPPTATDIETALEALSNIDDVTVTGDTSTGFEVTFQGSLVTTDVPEITVPVNTTGETITPSTTTNGVPPVLVINKVATNSIAGLSVGLPVKISTNLPSEDVVYISEIIGSVAPYYLRLADENGDQVDASTYTINNETLLSDLNGLNFSNIQIEGIDGYKFYSGLIQLAQWTIDGLDRDRSNYPGIGAAGTQFEVISPVLVKVSLVVNVTPISGVSLSSISNEVSSNILEYVNSREVGEDVILSEIIAAAQEVSGVFDVEVTNITENITIADGELARLSSEDIIIG